MKEVISRAMSVSTVVFIGTKSFGLNSSLDLFGFEYGSKSVGMIAGSLQNKKFNCDFLHRKSFGGLCRNLSDVNF